MAESRKQISEVSIVDQLSGEIIQSRAVYSSKFSESFIMVRTTDGLDWLWGLSGNEVKLILLMHQWAEPEKGRISLAAYQRELVCKHLGIAQRSIAGLLRELEAKDCVVKLGNNDYVVNPAHVFKCSTAEVRNRIREYEYLKTKIKRV